MEKIDYRQISFDYLCEVDNCYFASCVTFNGLLQINKDNLEANYICSFPNEAKYAEALHHKIYKFERMLVFAPNNAMGIHLYHLDTQRMFFWPVDNEKCVRNRCVDSFVYDDKLWLFYAFAEHPVVIFDLKTYQIEKYFGIMDVLPESIAKREKTAVFWSTLVQVGGKVYGVIWKSSYIVEVDLVSRTVSLHSILEEKLMLTAITSDGNSVWIAEAISKTLLKLDTKNRVIQKYTMQEQYLKSRSYFCNLIWCNNKLWILFDDLQTVFCINEEKNSVDEACFFPEKFKKMDDIRSKMRSFFNVEVSNGRVRIYPINSNMMLELDVEQMLIKGYSIRMSEGYDDGWYMKNFLESYYKELYLGKCMIEGKDISLKTYLDFL